jgi:hypothetical protein
MTYISKSKHFEVSSEDEPKEMCANKASNNGKCGFCFVKYSDESKQLGDWIQCQGKRKEWYHEDNTMLQLKAGSSSCVEDSDFNVCLHFLTSSKSKHTCSFTSVYSKLTFEVVFS